MSDYEKILSTLDGLLSMAQDPPADDEVRAKVCQAEPVLAAVTRLVRALIAANNGTEGFTLPELRWDKNTQMIYIRVGGTWFPLERSDHSIPTVRVRNLPPLLAVPVSSS